MRTFTRRDGGTSVFWAVELRDGFLTVTSGEVGTDGQRRSRPFADQARARQEHDRLIREKLAEGYAEVTAAPAPPSPLREAWEPTGDWYQDRWEMYEGDME